MEQPSSTEVTNTPKTFAEQKAEAQKVGEENVRETIDKVVTFLAPLGNLGGFAEIYKNEAKKRVAEMGNRIVEKWNKAADWATEQIYDAVDTGTYTVQALVRSGQEMGLGTMAGMEDVYKTAVHGVPEMVNGIKEWKNEKDISKFEQKLEKARQNITDNRTAKLQLREKRIAQGNFAARFNALQAQPVARQ